MTVSDPQVLLEEFSLVRDGRTLVEGGRWAVEPGQRVLLTGASGSGKSSFLLALAGLLDHAPGLEARGHWSVVPRPGVVFQNPYAQLVSPGLDEELAFGLENAGWSRPLMVERVEALKAAFGLAHLGGRAPWTFSGGEAQRVALAAALAPRPSLMLLDEPLGYLDPAAAQTLVNLATEKVRSTAWVVVDHDPRPWAAWADVHYRLENGRWERAPIPNDPREPRTLPRLAPAPVLEVRGLRVGYGRTPVLDGFDLLVNAGETVAVVGPSGAGKSTLFRALTGQVRPQAGTIRVSGSPFRPRLRRSSPFAWVPQVPEHYFVHPTVAQEWGDQPDAARAWGLGALAERHPFTLSEGEKRRLNLVSALATNRPILLLDEPQFGLDARSRDALEGALSDLRAQGRTIVFISHEPDFCARNAHRVVEVGR